MKKLLFLLSLSLVLVFAGCNTDEGNEDTSNNEEETNASEDAEGTENAEGSEDDQMALKGALLENQMALVTALRPAQQTINAYVSELAKPEEEIADAETLATMKADALAAAEEAVNTVDSFTLEGELTEDAKASFEAALADLKASYEAYVTALGTDAPDFAKAEENFKAFNDKLGTLFESVGLLKTDMAKELA